MIKTIYIYFLSLFLVFFLLDTGLLAQPTIEWEKGYGGSLADYANSIQQTNDGGYIVAGYSKSNDYDVGNNQGDRDFWIIKIDAFGMLEWESNFGGSKYDIAESIVESTEGGYIIAGYSLSNDGDVGANNRGSDYWVVKIDETGNLEWEQNYGGSKTDRAKVILESGEGGYIIAGSSLSSNGNVSGNYGERDIWIVKIDLAGNIEWEQNYGGSGDDRAESMQQTNDGGYVIAGFSGSEDGDVGETNGMWDFWILKIDVSGNIEWEQNYGGSDIDEAYSIQQTNDGGYIICGNSESNDGDFDAHKGHIDIWLVKTDPTGSLEWKQNYGGANSDEAYSVLQTDDGHFIIAGRSTSSDGDLPGFCSLAKAWFVKIDNSGAIIWQHICEGLHSAGVQSIQQTNDGGFIVAGFSNNLDISPSGIGFQAFFWVTKLSSCVSNATVHQIENTLTAVPSGLSYQWLDCNNDSLPIPNETNESFTPSSNGSYAVVTTDGICAATSDCFDFTMVGVSELEATLGISIFPNPTIEELHIYKENTEPVSMELVDFLGNTLISKKNIFQDSTIDLHNLASGVYLVVFTSEKGSVVRKIVKR